VFFDVFNENCGDFFPDGEVSNLWLATLLVRFLGCEKVTLSKVVGDLQPREKKEVTLNKVVQTNLFFLICQPSFILFKPEIHC